MGLGICKDDTTTDAPNSTVTTTYKFHTDWHLGRSDISYKYYNGILRETVDGETYTKTYGFFTTIDNKITIIPDDLTPTTENLEPPEDSESEFFTIDLNQVDDISVSANADAITSVSAFAITTAMDCDTISSSSVGLCRKNFRLSTIDEVN